MVKLLNFVVFYIFIMLVYLHDVYPTENMSSSHKSKKILGQIKALKEVMIMVEGKGKAHV